MSRRYVTRARVEQLADQLGARDWAILDTLGQVRLATGDQIQRLHFADLKPTSAARVRRRVLQRLTELRLTARLERRIGGVRAGSSGYVYSLGVAGQRLILGHGLAGGRPRKPWTPSRHFVRHRLGVTETFVRLAMLERNSGHLRIASFETEPECWRSFAGTGGQRRVLKPDAAIVLDHGPWEEHLLLEYDRATEGPAQVRRQLRAYWDYYRSGIEQHRHDVFPRVLWLVPDAERAEWLIDLASREPPESWRLHQIVPVDRLIEAITGEHQPTTKGDPHERR